VHVKVRVLHVLEEHYIIMAIVCLAGISFFGRIILIWIFRKWDVRVWTGSSWLRIGTGGGNL